MTVRSLPGSMTSVPTGNSREMVIDMRAPRKGGFWDQPTDAAMYKYLVVRAAIGIVAGVIAWFVGYSLLRGHIVFTG